ncbi:Cell division protein SepF [Nonomuraea coxensis DSM 45129]|uniref:Cell division protein SepF n=1 Tax=Nonomuraea coxensis DSM 45129 TaxID=1122611 RepID=A0ABX8U233_9ACTN|nr:cell division protein SepF [Nonomuraea coxensis]QYC40693.1 Cell division protein SepF [Nonomuraea coxensis DSM 45129]
MAGAMRKMAVYLGLVEDDRYERYETYQDDYAYEDEVQRTGEERPVAVQDRDDEPDAPVPAPRPSTAILERRTTDLARITTLHPRTYNEARTIGEHFRDGTPVIMNLTEMVDSDAKRLVDFAAGLVFGLHGSIERVTNKVFLLSPANVEVTAEDKARIAERGFFNQS